MKGVYIFLAEGFEDTEAIATIDMLCRAEIEVKTVCNQADYWEVTSSHGIDVGTELSFDEFLSLMELNGTDKNDFLIFPGGMPGASNLAANKTLMKLMIEHYAVGGSIAAICAAPSVVLSNLPDLDGKKMTCYPGFETALEEKGAIVTGEGVEVDGRLITGRGPGKTIDFALAIVTAIKGQECADKIAAEIMM